MKTVVNTNTLTKNYELLGELINSHLDLLKNDGHKNQQKIVEVCHTGKFLLFFNSRITIHKLSEQPDFILNSEFGKIGLEHQIVVDSKAKEKEGFLENIFALAEKKLRDDPTIPNFSANCHLYPYINFKLSQKENLVQVVSSVVKEFVQNNQLIENPLIERIFKSPHSQKSINPNLGAWWQKNVTGEIISNAIRKKEKKIAAYKQNTGLKQWLLLVIGSTGESSFEIDINLDIKIDSEFDAIYILEDFNNKLYQVK